MEKTMPHNLEAERAVLSSVFLDNSVLASLTDLLDPEDFYLESHQLIYQAMLDMFNKGMPVDTITIIEHLKATGKLEAAGGPAAVSDLVGLASTSVNVEYWAGIVKDKAMLRALITNASVILHEAYEEPEEVDEFLDRAEHKILEVAARKSASSYQPINQVITESFRALEDLEARKGMVLGVPSGFKDLDQLTSGFQKGDLIILAGRPSMGKTALALNITAHAALEAEKTVAFFSLEMAAQELVVRMLCAEAKVDSTKLRKGFFARNDWYSITNAAGKLGQTRIFIDDSSSLSVLELKARARRIKAEYGLDLVVVDYLQLLRGATARRARDSREQEIAEISRGLKGMAKELEIPVLALSQLNRAPETRGGGEPRLSDLRESGALEQDADVVMLIYRPGIYEKHEKGVDADDRRTILKVEKQRNGPTGIVELVFLKEFTRFEPYAGDYREEFVPGTSEPPF